MKGDLLAINVVSSWTVSIVSDRSNKYLFYSHAKIVCHLDAKSIRITDMINLGVTHMLYLVQSGHSVSLYPTGVK